MFGIGSTELLLILVVALVVLGPKSLAGFARTLGKFMGEFRKVSTEFQRTLNLETARAEAQEAARTQSGQVKKEEDKGQAPASSADKKEDTGSTAAYPDDSPIAQAVAKARAQAAGNSLQKTGAGEEIQEEGAAASKGGKPVGG